MFSSEGGRFNRLNHNTIENENIILLLNSKNLTVRAYKSGEYVFSEQSLSNLINDTQGNEWTVNEEALVRKSDQLPLKRLPGHLSYWFGWFAFFPKTLVWEK